MDAMLLAEDSDEKAVLSLVLRRAGLAVTLAQDLDRAMKSWLERPAEWWPSCASGALLPALVVSEWSSGRHASGIALPPCRSDSHRRS